MPLILNIQYGRNNDKTAIIATDLTGTGATGYGTGSNPVVGDFSSFLIRVTPPDPVTLLPGTTYYDVEAFPTLPSASGGSFSIPNTSLGGTPTTILPDGIYLFEVTGLYDIPGGEAPPVTATRRKAFYEIVGCCITNMTLALSPCNCKGKTDKMRNMIKANIWLTLLKPYITEGGIIQPSSIESCGDWNKAGEIIRSLQTICNNQNCNPCNDC